MAETSMTRLLAFFAILSALPAIALWPWLPGLVLVLWLAWVGSGEVTRRQG